MTTRELAIRIDQALVGGGQPTRQSIADRTWILDRYHALTRDMTIHEASATARRQWLDMVLAEWRKSHDS